VSIFELTINPNVVVCWFPKMNKVRELTGADGDSNCNRTKHECIVNVVNFSTCTPELIFHQPMQGTCSAL
jgi:hypothetical protein